MIKLKKIFWFICLINKKFFFTLFLILTYSLSFAETFDTRDDSKPFWTHSFRMNLCYFQPFGKHADWIEPGFGFNGKYLYNPKIMENLTFNADISYFRGKYKNNASYNYYIVPLGLGAEYELPLISDLSFKPGLGTGMYFLSTPVETYHNPYIKIEGLLDYKLTENLILGFSVSYLHLYDKIESIKAFSYSGAFQYAFGQPLVYKDIYVETSSLVRVFPAVYSAYTKEPVGTLRIKNTTDGIIKDIRVYFSVKGYCEKTEAKVKIPDMPANKLFEVPLTGIFNAEVLNVLNTVQAPGIIEIGYLKEGRSCLKRTSIPVIIYGRNTINWQEPARIGAFSTYMDDSILTISRTIYSTMVAQSDLPDYIQSLIKIFTVLKVFGVRYVKDPEIPFDSVSASSVDTVQFPYQTLKNRAGDCDDLCVLLASLLESIGIRTAYVFVQGHVFLMIQVQNDYKGKVIKYQGSDWIPVECTMIQEGLFNALQKGYENFEKYPKKKIILLQEAVKAFPPMAIKGENVSVIFNPGQFAKLVDEQFQKMAEKKN